MPKIKGISREMLQSYVGMRQKIDIDADAIQSITSMLALLENCGDDCSDFDPVALGQVNRMMNTNILNIRETLDDFIYIVRAKAEFD
jgi:hypothetical protein